MGVKLYNLIKITAGGLHGWFESEEGIIRKPMSAWKGSEKLDELLEKKVVLEEVTPTLKWYQRFLSWIKRLIKIK